MDKNKKNTDLEKELDEMTSQMAKKLLDFFDERDTTGLKGLSFMSRLASEGGCIVSTADCSVMEIANATERGDFFADGDNLGYIRRIPEWLGKRDPGCRAAKQEDSEPPQKDSQTIIDPQKFIKKALSQVGVMGDGIYDRPKVMFDPIDETYLIQVAPEILKEEAWKVCAIEITKEAMVGFKPYTGDLIIPPDLFEERIGSEGYKILQAMFTYFVREGVGKMTDKVFVKMSYQRESRDFLLSWKVMAMIYRNAEVRG